MDKGLAIGLALGIFASIFMNVGKGVQKQKVDVLKKGRDMFKPAHRRDFRIWLIGVLMTVCAAGLYSASLKFTDKASIIAALSGTGLVGLLIFAALVLKESIGFREIFSSGLIIIGTGMVSYFDQPLSETQEYNLGNFIYMIIGLLAIFGALSIAGAKSARFHGFAFGLVAGSFIGLAMILADMALVRSGGDLITQFLNPYVYFAMISALSALAITQVAFFKGTAVLVVPTINSFIILTPLVVEYFTFGTLLNLVQYLGVAVIVIGIVILTTSPKQVFQA
jgi:drug/metabolite transporter (DMT)-like permease